MIKKAEKYAEKCHKETNHLYDGQSYMLHLYMVLDVARHFIELIPQDAWEDVASSCFVHDVIEDTRQTYNDVKNELNERIADIAYALTNEKGKTRAERANHLYYQGIRSTPFARFVKLCDRIANVEYSSQSGSSMFEKYRNENDKFVAELKDFESDCYKPMFDYLNELFNN